VTVVRGIVTELTILRLTVLTVAVVKGGCSGSTRAETDAVGSVDVTGVLTVDLDPVVGDVGAVGAFSTSVLWCHDY